MLTARLADFFRQDDDDEPEPSETEEGRGLRAYCGWQETVKADVAKGRRPPPLPEAVLHASILNQAAFEEQHWHATWARMRYAEWLLAGSKKLPESYPEWPMDTQLRAIDRLEALTKPG